MIWLDDATISPSSATASIRVPETMWQVRGLGSAPNARGVVRWWVRAIMSCLSSWKCIGPSVGVRCSGETGTQ